MWHSVAVTVVVVYSSANAEKAEEDSNIQVEINDNKVDFMWRYKL